MRNKLKRTAATALAVLLCAGMAYSPADAAKKAKISKTKLTLKVGQSKTLSVKNLSKKKAKKLKWSTSNKKVATVNKKGKVAAKKAGKATITAKLGKKKYTCKVTVKKKTASNPKTPAKTKEQLAAEDRAYLQAMIKKQRAAGAKISEDLDSKSDYEWNADGRLIRLDWEEDEGSDLDVTGAIDVTPFTALESLRLGYNHKITSVNVKGISTLKELLLDAVPITSIDVTTNVNLDDLSVSMCKLSSLDVSKNKKLTSLWCYKTQIKKLDVSKNPALKSLGCYGLGLTSLDVTHNPALTRLSCTGNNFTTLDLSAQGKFGKVTVRCDENVTIKGANYNISVNEGY